MQRKPRFFFGGLIWTIVIVATGYGVFVAYERWWGTPEFKARVSEAQEKAGEVLGVATEWVTDLVKQSAKEKVGEVIVSAGDSLGVYGEQLKGTSTLVSGNVVPKKTPVDIGISVPVATPLSFLLPSASFYSVNWGDGRKEEKSVSEKNGITITHKWSVPGRFEIVIEARVGEDVSKESFIVNVTDK